MGNVDIETLARTLGLLGAWVATLVGLWLLVAPRSFAAVNAYLSAGFSVRRSMRTLEIPRRSERVFYRYHVITGGLLVIAGAYILFATLAQWEPNRIATLFRADWRWAGEWLGSAGRALLMVVGFVGVVLGLAVAARPSSLKGIEAYANHWVSGRRALRKWEQPLHGIDRMVTQYPRRVGGALLAVGLLLHGIMAVTVI